MFKKIKGILVLTMFFFGVLLMIGCESEEARILADRTNQIPQDGVVDQEIFEAIRESGDIGIFNGTNQNVDFQWLFIGSQIETPRTENLMINFSNARTSEVREALGTEYVQEFSFASGDGILGNPSLTIYFAVPWDVEAVLLYHHETGEIIDEASIDNVPNGVVTFTPQQFSGLFHLVGIRDLDEAMADGEMTDVASFLGLNTNQNSGGSSEASEGATAGQLSGDSSSGDTPNRGGGGGVPGRPNPVDPEDQVVNENNQLTATLSISVAVLVDNDLLDSAKRPLVPSDGWIMRPRTVTFSEGESVFDVLQRETRNSGIHMEFNFVPVFNSAYIRGIHNLYEFDAGPLSGWVYKVNGWGPNFGSSRYILEQGDVIEWHFTVDLGRDVGVYVGH